jgi:putative colanic acid biosysnthesis UDP-glucose lipid carrier transferase
MDLQDIKEAGAAKVPVVKPISHRNVADDAAIPAGEPLRRGRLTDVNPGATADTPILRDPANVEAAYDAEPGPADKAERSAHSFFPRGRSSRLYPLLTELWQLLDASVTGAVLYALSWVSGTPFNDEYAILICVTAVLMAFVYSWSDLFYRLRTRTLAEEVWRLLRGWATVLGLLLLIQYLFDLHGLYPRELLLSWAVAAYFAQMLVHAGIRKTLHSLRARGYNIRHAVLVGCGQPLESFAEFINENPWLGISIEGYLAEPHWSRENPEHRRHGCGPSAGRCTGRAGAAGGKPAERLRYLGRISDIGSLVNDLSLGEIYVTLPLERSVDAERVIRELINVPVNVNWIPDFSLTQPLGTRTDYLVGRPLVLLSDSRIDRHGQLVKEIEDLALSLAVVALAAPLLLALALAVKFSSPGPVLFKQRRRGLGGRPIEVWKFRTMHAVPEGEIAKQAIPNDTRVTRVGRWLRRSSLDELPQLFNVLQGQMSLVGPRPHPVWLDDKFANMVGGYMQRHRVKPGLTGWAQVHGYRGETDAPDKMEERLRHDLYYITHWSPWLDIKILALTVPAVLSAKNAH